MAKNILSPEVYRHINLLMKEKWAGSLTGYFGDDIVIAPYSDQPAGQVWTLMGSTGVGENTSIEEEILSFTFLSRETCLAHRWHASREYCNPTLDQGMFKQVNTKLRDVLCYLVLENKVFEPVKICLADNIYTQADSSPPCYHLNITAFMKQSGGYVIRPGEHFLYIRISGPRPGRWELSS